MGAFFNVADDAVVNTDPRDLVKDEFQKYFSDEEIVPMLFSELCALDMIYAVAKMRDGYYHDRLVLKGGMSVRNRVPLLDHRFSFDADYDPNSYAGYHFGDVDEIRFDLLKHASVRKCTIISNSTKNDANFLFLELNYREKLRTTGYTIIERPKIELCKRCRIFQEPEESEVATMIDLSLIGIEPLTVKHVGLEEQLATKLFIIGDLRRGKRNHFDAYDVLRIVDSNNSDLDWKLVKKMFEARVEKHKVTGRTIKPSEQVKECRRQLGTMKLNANKKTSLAGVLFKKDFDFDWMVDRVNDVYDYVV